MVWELPKIQEQHQKTCSPRVGYSQEYPQERLMQVGYSREYPQEEH